MFQSSAHHMTEGSCGRIPPAHQVSQTNQTEGKENKKNTYKDLMNKFEIQYQNKTLH